MLDLKYEKHSFDVIWCEGASICPPDNFANSIVCIPGPQPISSMRGFAGRFFSILNALRVDLLSPGPSLGR